MAEIPQQKVAALEKKVGGGGKSPLFAQLASYYLQAGKVKEALQLCDTGLAAFPHYSTGHLVKGKTLLALKMNAEARREFEIVQEFLPGNETVAFILSNIQPGEGESLTTPAAEPASFEPTSTAPPIPAEPTATQGETSPATIFDTVAPEPPVAAPPEEAAPAPASFFEAVATSPEAAEDPFGFGGGTVAETAPPPQVPAQEESVNPFEGFPTQPEPATTEAVPSSDIFGIGAQQEAAPQAVSEEESFEAFSNRMKGELGGENSMTLEEYLQPSSTDQPAEQQQTPPEPSGETIEDLAEKLQSAKKITPVINLSTKTTSPASEADTPASTGFVTPTLAEIYAKQGWYDDAIKAYRTLCINKPAEKDRFEKRITELEELKKQQG